MQHAEVVGIGGQSMDQMKLGLPLWRQHWTRIDALCPGPEHPALPPEDSAERALGDGRNLPDEIELIILQPYTHARIELGQYLERLRSKETSLVSRWDVKQLSAFPPSRLHSCLTHQFVG